MADHAVGWAATKSATRVARLAAKAAVAAADFRVTDHTLPGLTADAARAAAGAKVAADQYFAETRRAYVSAVLGA